MRVVVIDNDSLEAKQSYYFSKRIPVATGLLIGRMTPTRDHVLALVQTPDEDPDSPNTKGWDAVDETWVVEHAKEVQRMMPGGLCVMGIFFFCPADQVSTGGSKMNLASSILRKIARFQDASGGIDASGDDGSERLFFHMCSKTKRNTCKALPVRDATKTAHPAELKTQADLASSLVSLSASFRFRLALPLLPKGHAEAPLEDKELWKGVRAQLTAQLAGVDRAVALCNGKLAGPEPLVADGGGGGKGKGKGGKGGKADAAAAAAAGAGAEVLVELLSDGELDGGALGKEGGALIEGEVLAVAQVLGSESAESAVQALKHDLKASLLTRMEMLDEECHMEGEDGGASAPASLYSVWAAGKPARWTLPRRLQFPIGGGIQLSQHIMVDERAAAAAQEQEALDNLKLLLPDVPALAERAEAAGFFRWNEGKAAAGGGGGGGAGSQRPASAAPASSAAASGGATAGQQGGGGMGKYIAAAAVVGLYCLELAFDFLPFI